MSHGYVHIGEHRGVLSNISRRLMLSLYKAGYTDYYGLADHYGRLSLVYDWSM